jgi:hypothetical protein
LKVERPPLFRNFSLELAAIFLPREMRSKPHGKREKAAHSPARNVPEQRWSCKINIDNHLAIPMAPIAMNISTYNSNDTLQLDNEYQNWEMNESVSSSTILVVTALTFGVAAIAMGVLLVVGILPFIVAIPAAAALALACVTSGTFGAFLDSDQENEETPNAEEEVPEEKNEWTEVEGEEPGEWFVIEDGEPDEPESTSKKAEKSAIEILNSDLTNKDPLDDVLIDGGDMKGTKSIMLIPSHIRRLTKDQRDSIETITFRGNVGDHYHFMAEGGVAIVLTKLNSLKKLHNLKTVNVRNEDELADLSDRLVRLRHCLNPITVKILD